MNKGIRRVPLAGYPGYEIDEYSRVFDSKGRHIPDVGSPDYYRNITLDGKSEIVHRLMAFSFLGEPPFPDMEVNHIDGVKSNNVLSNLEWVTRRENLIHAYETGLRTDNTFLEVKDLRDGTVLEFYSIQECGRIFGLTGAAILQYLKRDRVRLLNNFYLVRRKGDEWPEYDPATVGMYKRGTPKPVMVEDKNGDITIFENITVLGEKLGRKPALLREYLTRNKDKPLDGLIIRFIDNIFDFNNLKKKYPFEPYTKVRKINYVSNKPPVPITVTDREGGVETWPSSEEFCKFHGVKKSTFQKAVWTKGSWNGFMVDYLR